MVSNILLCVYVGGYAMNLFFCYLHFSGKNGREQLTTENFVFSIAVSLVWPVLWVLTLVFWLRANKLL